MKKKLIRRVLGFKAQFAQLIAECRKGQTIRAVWKRPIKVGQHVSLWRGLRTKNCEFMGGWPVLKVERIKIMANRIIVDGLFLLTEQAEDLARADGFDSLWDMREWFEKQYGLPFTGVIIKWRDDEWIKANSQKSSI